MRIIRRAIPGCWVPRSTRLAGLRKQQGWRRDGQEVDRSRSGDQCRRNRSRPIQFGRNGISSSSRNRPQCGSGAVQPISRSQPRANADVVGGGFLSSASLGAFQHPGRTAPRVCPSGSRIGCLETTQARARASTRLWSSGTDRGRLGRQQWKQSAPRVRRRKGQGRVGERKGRRNRGGVYQPLTIKFQSAPQRAARRPEPAVTGKPAILAVLLTATCSRIPCIE